MKVGRPRLLDDSHKTELLQWYASGGRDFREKGDQLGVSGFTLRRYIKRWLNGTPVREEVVE